MLKLEDLIGYRESVLEEKFNHIIIFDHQYFIDKYELQEYINEDLTYDEWKLFLRIQKENAYDLIADICDEDEAISEVMTAKGKFKFNKSSDLKKLFGSLYSYYCSFTYGDYNNGIISNFFSDLLDEFKDYFYYENNIFSGLSETDKFVINNMLQRKFI